MRQSTVKAGDGLNYDWANDHVFIKTPLELTNGRVTVVEDILKPGFHLARHQHRSMVEIFIVLEGEVTFIFDDETVTASTGDTVTVPAGIWHGAQSEAGARMITVFTPGGFDHYLAELAGMDEAQLADPGVMTSLGEKYDIWVG